MSDRTITLPADLARDLETIAQQQGRSLDEYVMALLREQLPAPMGNWALAVAQGMDAAEIDWIDDPDASANSRKHFHDYLDRKRRQLHKTDESDA